MNPFSCFYFIRENKTRCFLLIFMIFLGYAVYLGGLYVTNVMDNWNTPIEYRDKFVLIFPETEEERAELENFRKKAGEDNKARGLTFSSFNSFNWKTLMGFENGQFAFTFCSVEDFKAYCEFMDISCDFDSLKDGSMIMSERFAKNRGLAPGDCIDMEYGENIYGEYILDALTKEDGYTLYFIDQVLGAENAGMMVIGKELSAEELKAYVQEMYGNYQESTLKEDVWEQFETFYTIYIFIVILVALIMAVTINAAFVGMYQRRTFEFAVYRAIGISKRRIIGKIAGELLCMDAVALTAGGIVFFLALYLFNNLVLYPSGLYLRYYDRTALAGLVICNVMVVVPMILTRCRKLLKADICEY